MPLEAARQHVARVRVSDFGVRPLAEADLSRLWFGQTFPPEALVTAEGERLRVIYRGRAGGGRGPDFRDALIGAPGGLLRGDVELHVRSSDFYRHGHHRDPAYGGVVLHLVFWDDERRPTALPGGKTAPVAALGNWAEYRAQEMARWLERPALWHEPCFSALARDGAPLVAATLERLGDMRFRRKTAALVPIIGREGEEEALWQSLLEAVAFGPDRERFRLLAQKVRWASFRARLCSLPRAGRAAAALYTLEAAFAGIQVSRKAVRRPANRPERRLEGAARLAARFAEKGLGESFLDAFQEGIWQGQREEGHIERAKVERQTRHGEARFLVSNFEFRSPKRPGPERRATASVIAALTIPGLVGRARALEIVANAVLPWLAALGPEASAHRAEAVFGCLPLPARYGAVRHLHEAVGAVAREPRGQEQAVPINFRRQQGMLYLLDHYCTQGGCGRCPLS
ncbi:MAG: DUF2851 family protein [Chloroflexi bacterium]|nr:MAG: DUF2851 family protein [Chloroflexota bacterium]